MAITSQELRQVEFGSELRGYKTAEVDDFLEKVAVGVDAVRAELAALRERLERAERVSAERSNLEDEESIRRTLVLAQRTADLAIKEAQEEAAQLVDGARADAESIVSDARAAADRIAGEADRNLRDEVGRLAEDRDSLQAEIEDLGRLIVAERGRLTESLSAILRFVEKNVTEPVTSFSTPPPMPAADAGPTGEAAPPGSGGRSAVEDDLEAAIAEDAAAAAPPPSGYLPEDGWAEEEWTGPSGSSRPSLMALPNLDDLGLDGGDTQPNPSWGFDGEAGTPAS